MTMPEPVTLGDYLRLTSAIFGPESPSAKFFQEKIAEQGPDEVVIQHSSQMLLLCMHLEKQARPADDVVPDVTHDPGDSACVLHDPTAFYTAVVHRCPVCR